MMDYIVISWNALLGQYFMMWHVCIMQSPTIILSDLCSVDHVQSEKTIIIKHDSICISRGLTILPVGLQQHQNTYIFVALNRTDYLYILAPHQNTCIY